MAVVVASLPAGRTVTSSKTWTVETLAARRRAAPLQRCGSRRAVRRRTRCSRPLMRRQSTRSSSSPRDARARRHAGYPRPNPQATRTQAASAPPANGRARRPSAPPPPASRLSPPGSRLPTPVTLLYAAPRLPSTPTPLPPHRLRSCIVTPLRTSTSVWPGGALGTWRTPPTRWSTSPAASVPTSAFSNRHAVRANARLPLRAWRSNRATCCSCRVAGGTRSIPRAP